MNETERISRPPDNLTRDQLVGMYRQMRLIRSFETTAKEHFQAGQIAGIMHLSAGQEAVPVGTCSALRGDDFITSTHRGHGDVIAKGCEVKYMFAELYGRTTGYCKGKGGSMHIADFSQGIIGANGIVSGGLPVAIGVALSCKMRQTDQVAVCFFGDGATAEGAFHEALNLASLWQLPLIFVCQNNLYGLSQPWEETTYGCDLATRVRTYNMAAECVDGMDVMEIYGAARNAVERARQGGGPSFIEAKTYRYLGHFVGDATLYMPEAQVSAWRERDPLENLERRLLEWGYLTQEEDDEMQAGIEREIQAALEFANASPIPAPESALENVYVHFDHQGRPLGE